jgi:cellulose synthase/poly-beta-1,6-N-acetylglucosamine synthase-like glycosyltransferase
VDLSTVHLQREQWRDPKKKKKKGKGKKADLQWLTVLMAAVAVAERSCWCGGGASDDGSHRFLPFFSLFSFSLFSFLFPLSVLSSRSLFCSSLLSLYSSLFFFFVFLLFFLCFFFLF